MSDYQQYPDPKPRGKHARERASEGSQQQGRSEVPQDVSRQEPSPADGGQPAAQQSIPHQQPVSQQRAYVSAGQRPASQTRTNVGQRRASQAGRGRPTSGGVVPPPVGRASQQSDAYRVAQQSAYRPVNPAAGVGASKTALGGGEKKKKGGPWRVVFWMALVVFIGSLIALGLIGFSYWQGQQSYREVAQEGFTPPDDFEGTALVDLTVDWEALRAINPEIVGWIYIPGTVVNYPVMHASDNDKYLTHDFKGSTGWIATFGAIFLDAENKGDFSDANNFIYGHHMNDGSMFACIADFEDASQFNAHRTVYLLTPQGNYKLNTFSLVHCAADERLVWTQFASEEERVTYVQDKIDRSVVPVSDIPAAGDMKKTFAFSTCDNLADNGRFVLYAYVEESTVASNEALIDPDAIAAVDEAAQTAVDEVAAEAAEEPTADMATA